MRCVKEYDILAINNMEAKEIQTIDVVNSLIELKPNRVYVLIAEWNQKNILENKCFGTAEYVFATT